jgi:Tfp pilus assembly protein PilV
MNIETPIHSRKRSTVGFTLVEMIVATFLTILGLTGVHNMLYWIMYSTTFSGQRTLAASLSQDKMEELLSAGYLESSSGQDSQFPYDRQWQVNTPSTDQQEISVSVIWDDLKRQSHELTMRTILADSRISAVGLPFNKPNK